MTKIEEAKVILEALGLPKSQQNEISALTLLALCNIKKRTKWGNASQNNLGISKGIMTFINENYGKKYAPNTRETFRREVLHQFIQAAIVIYNPESPEIPVNSPKAHYSITNEALDVIKLFGTPNWELAIQKYIASAGALKDKYDNKRNIKMIPLKLKDGNEIFLSPGKHNEIQAMIITEFAERFIKNGILLYLGDTEKKDLVFERAELENLGVKLDQHQKLPDVIIYDSKREWLFLIEAVASHGPVSPKRLFELEQLFKNCKSEKIYVTAFPNFSEFKKYSSQIAWETEVWVAEIPDHMIHFNGDKFLG